MGPFAAAGVVVLFVGFVLVSKLGLGNALAPMDLAAIRFAVAGILMAPVLFKHRLMGLRLGQACLLAGSGGLGFALFAYWGMSLAPANHGSALIHGTLPLTTGPSSRAWWQAFGRRVWRHGRWVRRPWAWWPSWPPACSGLVAGN